MERTFWVTHRDEGHHYVDHASTHAHVLGVSGLHASGHVDHVCVVVDLKQKPRGCEDRPKATGLTFLTLQLKSGKPRGPVDRKEAAAVGEKSCDLELGDWDAAWLCPESQVIVALLDSEPQLLHLENGIWTGPP